MATRIRLRRVGRKKQASFRIVVAGSIHARSGRITEAIGKYNPRTHPSYVEIDEVRALHWLRQGARLSESVEPLFRKAGILQKFAEGSEGEGVTVIGDGQGQTVLATRPAAARTTAEPKPKAEAKEKPKAEAKKEPEPKVEAKKEPEPKAEAKERPDAKAEEESKAEAKTEVEEKPKAKAKRKAKAEAADQAAESEEPGEATEPADEEEKK